MNTEQTILAQANAAIQMIRLDLAETQALLAALPPASADELRGVLRNLCLTVIMQ
jgi:hypothetical protein